MANGIEINEENFKTLDTGPQLETIFENVLAIKKHVLLQPGLCEATMDTKIKAANKRRNRINIGLGGGSGVGAVGIWELFKAWISNG